MEKVFNEIALSGQILTEDKTDSGLIDKQSFNANRVRLEDSTIGERARLRYRCPNCYTEYTTKQRYKVGDNYGQQIGRAFTFRNIFAWIVDNTVGNLPIIGETLSVHADQAETKKGAQITERRADKVKMEAFEAEMTAIFSKCNNQHGVCCKNCKS